jgi:hypothetical protein
MRDQFLNPAAAGVITAVAVVLVTQASAQSLTGLVTMLKTPWGEPDLEGIWSAEFDTPLQRSAKYADQEFFTEAQQVELDKERSATLADVRPKHGTRRMPPVFLGGSLIPSVQFLWQRNPQTYIR